MAGGLDVDEDALEVETPPHQFATMLCVGRVRERLKRHAWKACRAKTLKGSNPFPSVPRFAFRRKTHSLPRPPL